MFDAAPERRQRRTGLGLTTRLAGREAHSTGPLAALSHRRLFFAFAFISFQSVLQRRPEEDAGGVPASPAS
jgi:hypothetical protein